MPLSRIFNYDFFAVDNNNRQRPRLVASIKLSLLITIVAGFVIDIVLLCYGPSVIDEYLAPHKSDDEVKCMKTVWTAFLSLNIVFCVLGFIGVLFEQISCVFIFSIYMFFVSFGTFFDTISKNHLAALCMILITLMSLVFGAILRIERLEPEPPQQRRFSTVSAFKV